MSCLERPELLHSVTNDGSSLCTNGAVAKDRSPANQSEITLCPYPIDPLPGEPLPDEYDLLIYAKNGHRPQLLEHLPKVFPRHFQIH